MAEFDQALATFEANVAQALKRAESLVKTLRRLHGAAKAGNVAEIETAAVLARQVAHEAETAADGVSGAWVFDARSYLADGYLAELREQAAKAGVELIERDGRISCFPLLLRVEPRELAVRVNKKLTRRIRPRELVEHLKTARNRPLRFGAERFAELLYKAYERIAGKQWMSGGRDRGDHVLLAEIHELLTILPGNDYTVEEFGRDLLLLDRKPDQRTRGGLSFEFGASTLAKSKASRISVYDESGREHTYIAIRFKRVE